MTDGCRPITMLMVEDNPADVCIFQEALKETALAVELYIVTDGKSAMEFLARWGASVNAPRPDVVVLDLNLPMMNGQEMLIEMMSQPLLSSIPVAVLTTSDCEQCVCQLCPPGRCRYFTKTDDFAHLQGIVRQIEQHARSHLG